MNIRGIYRSFATAGALAVLCVGALGQGKHGGGNGNGHGNGNGGGHGHEERQERGGGDHGNRGGNGNGWGRQRGGDDGGQQRAWQQQMGQQQEWARGEQRQQQRQQEQWARQQQRQQEQANRQQQRQNEWNARRQHDQYEQQQRAYQRQIYQPQWQERRRDEDRGDNGRHLGWYKNGKAYTDDGRPYASTRDWRYEDRSRDNEGDRHRDLRGVRNRNSYNYYEYNAPSVNYYRSYSQPNYYQRSGSTRESFVRSLIGSFLAPQARYYQPERSYIPYRAYQSYSPYNGGYESPYYQSSYSPSYGVYSPYSAYDPGYGYGYDPYTSYGYEPDYGAQMFSGGGLKSTLLNVGFSLLQGFLSNGYQQGQDQGEYVLDEYGRPVNNYYDPYQAADAGYYSPLASSFADQRQILQEGYRLGYRDAMRDADPYGDAVESTPVNLVSQFLANTLVNRI